MITPDINKLLKLGKIPSKISESDNEDQNE